MVSPAQVVANPKPKRKSKLETHPAYQEDIAGVVGQLPPILTIEEAADALRVSRSQIKAAIKSGRLRSHKLSPARQGVVRITSHAVGDFLAERIA